MLEIAAFAPLAIVGTVAIVLWWERRQVRLERRRK
jgi:hypothetical protein